MSQQGKPIEVKLKFTGDSSSASKALQDLEKQAQRTSKAAADAQKQLQRSTRVGQYDRGPGGLGGLEAGSNITFGRSGGSGFDKLQSAASMLTTAFSRLAVAATVATQATETAGGVRRTINNDWLMSQKAEGIDPLTGLPDNYAFRQFRESVPGAGYLFRKSREADANLAYGKKLGESDSDRERFLGNEQVRNATAGFAAQRDAMVAQQRQAEAMRRAGQAPAMVDRDAIRQRYGIRFEDQFVDLHRNLNMANLNQGRSLAALDVSKQDERQKRLVADQLQRQYDAISRNPNDYKANEVNEVGGRLRQAQDRLRESIERRTKSEEDVRDANTDVRSAIKDLAQGVVRQKQTLFDEAKAGGIAFGAMNTTDQYDVLANAAQLQQNGYGSLSPYQKQQLLGNQNTREWAEKYAFEDAKNNPLFAALQDIQGKKSLSEQERELREAQRSLEAKITFDTQSMIEAFDAALKANGLTAAQIAAVAAANAERQIRQGMEQGRHAQMNGLDA